MTEAQSLATPSAAARLHPPPRVVLAKLGLDGHDRGIQVVARALRDAGMEVIYTGLWQTTAAAVRAAEDEDADVLGVSILSGAHMSLVPELIDRLRQRGMQHVLVVVGGIIPEADVPRLQALGVARVFRPGSSLTDIAQFIHQAVAARRQGTLPPGRTGDA
jgi:methylmalonyl-CoA mutase C-terminal domain/subunit